MSEANSIDSGYFPLPALLPQHKNHNEWNISNLKKTKKEILIGKLLAVQRERAKRRRLTPENLAQHRLTHGNSMDEEKNKTTGFAMKRFKEKGGSRKTRRKRKTRRRKKRRKTKK
uniref:Uncharacterized protein n=1 Tax=viral metagenome TaxID=1070528 RepID=A0A6C0ELR3_9ZZZZ